MGEDDRLEKVHDKITPKTKKIRQHFAPINTLVPENSCLEIILLNFFKNLDFAKLLMVRKLQPLFSKQNHYTKVQTY